jgi:hypothetical protein
MRIPKAAAVGAVIAAGVTAALVGQTMAADAGAPAPSDRTRYAHTRLSFPESVTTSLNTPKTLLKITVHAPAAGTAEVHLDTQLWTDFPDTIGGPGLTARQTIGRCSAIDTLAAKKCQGTTKYYFQKAGDMPSEDATLPYSLTAQLTFAAAGNRTIYLNGSSELNLGGLYGENSAYVEAQFTPTHPIAASARITVTAALPAG